MTDYLPEEPGIGKPVIGAGIAVLLVLVVGGWYYWGRHRAPKPDAPAVAATQGAPPQTATEAKIEHPVPTNPSAPLPELNDSDKVISAALAEATGGAASSYLVPESIIRHLVVTVDNLPRQKVAVDKRPVLRAPGTFVVKGDELHATLDPQNYQRYAPMVEALRAIDMKRVAAVYLRFYPLFQKAFQDLGYPNDYFNDRLVKVIDGLVLTPQVSGPIDLVRPNVMYLFADPGLESRPAGQKLLIRMGPDNAKVVKDKLTELRSSIVTGPATH